MRDIYELFQELNATISLDKKILLTEGLTYYELRRFVTLIYKMAKEKETKAVLAELLKILAVLEIKKLPVPTIQKLKAASPQIFN